MAVIFFIAVILPLVGFFLALSLDIGIFYRSRADFQQVLDKAALNAAKALPFQDKARFKAEEYVKRYGSPGATLLSVDVGGNHVELSGRGTSPLFFSKFFGLQNADAVLRSGAFAFDASAQAKVAPLDVAIYVDNSGYMAPDVSGSQAVAFGDQSSDTYWPAAQLFRSGQIEFPNPIDARIATQQCFNPGFSAMKEAAIRLYDYLGAMPLNSVGVYMGPGTAHPVDTIRDVEPAGFENQNPGEGVFGYYRSDTARDEYCLAVAEREGVHAGYTFPTIAPEGYFPLHGSRPLHLTRSGTFELPLQSSGYLSAREIIWSRAAQKGREADFTEILDTVVKGLLGADYRTDRQGFNHEVTKMGVIFLGDLPRVGGRRLLDGVSLTESLDEKHWEQDPVVSNISYSLRILNQLAELMKINLNLYVVLVRHEGIYRKIGSNGEQLENSDACRFSNDLMVHQPRCRRFFDETDLFEDLMSYLTQQNSNLKFYMMRAADSASLAQDFIANFALTNHTTVLVK